MKITSLIIMETLMVAGAIIGSTMLAMNIDASKWGYIFFLVSSISGVYVGLKTRVNSLTIMSVYFSVINSIGTYRWFLS